MFFFFLSITTSLYFAIIGVLLLSLLLAFYFLKGRAKQIVGILINLISVISFVSFLVYLTQSTKPFCSPAVATSVMLFFLFFILLFIGIVYVTDRGKK